MNYYEIPAISQSGLTTLSQSPRFYKYGIRKSDSDAMTMGSIVDCMLTEPEEFENLFYISEGIRPTAQLLDFTNIMINLYRLDSVLIDLYPLAYDELKSKNGGKLQKNLESFIQRFETEAFKYFTEKVTVDKKVITKEQLETAQKVVTNLITHPFTKNYFIEPHTDIKVLKQVEILFDYESVRKVACKAKLDGLTINHKDKWIKPWDIKVKEGSVYGFLDSFVMFRYDLQAAFYELAVYEYCKQNELYKEDGHIYDILPFEFVVNSSEYPEYPLIYTCTQKNIETGRDGGNMRGRFYKGYKQLIEDLIWHEDNNKWDYPREVYENRGKVMINIE